MALFNFSRDGFQHMLAWGSLSACSVLGVFEGARAWVLKSERMLGSLVLGLDAKYELCVHKTMYYATAVLPC